MTAVCTEARMRRGFRLAYALGGALLLSSCTPGGKLIVTVIGDRPVAAVVSPRSPAAEAGLQPGDEFHGVPLRAFVARLAGRPGESVELSYRRDGEVRRTRLTLREYL